MIMNSEKQILYSSDEAATKKTVVGWVSSDGIFFKDEHNARWRGCTHSMCECGEIKKKNYTLCDKCLNKKRIERYNSLKFKEWNGEDYLCLYDGDQYFWSTDDIEYYLEDNNLEPEDLRLVICRPNEFSNIDVDFWCDDLAEDGELPKEMLKKLKELNDYINNLKPASWAPSDIRTEYKRQ